MTHTITLIPGDGVGKEVIPAAHEVLVSLDLPLEFREARAGFSTFEEVGTALPQETIDACASSDAVIFGATQSPMDKVEGYFSPIIALRNHFNLFANVRPALRPGYSALGEDVTPIDILIIRENTEGLYSGREHLEDDGRTAVTERVITEHATRRIVDFACQQAMQRPRKKLTLVHKANVLKETDGLFRRVGFEVTANYPELQVDEKLVDAVAMLMAMEPRQFDTIVTTNLFGDILSDLAAGLTGGPGIAPSANMGENPPAVFEPVHGSAPDIAGQGIADPRAAILSAAMLLDHLGYADQATHIREAVYATFHKADTQGTTRTVIRRLSR